MQPDIEIYVKDLENNKLLSWLSQHFVLNEAHALTQDASSSRPRTILLKAQSCEIELTITPNAAGKKYTSLWFKSSKTPWNTDLECAEDMVGNHSAEEARCSAGSWTESEAESSEQWWVVTENNKKKVGWF